MFVVVSIEFFSPSSPVLPWITQESVQRFWLEYFLFLALSTITVYSHSHTAIFYHFHLLQQVLRCVETHAKADGAFEASNLFVILSVLDSSPISFRFRSFETCCSTNFSYCSLPVVLTSGISTIIASSWPPFI